MVDGLHRCRGATAEGGIEQEEIGKGEGMQAVEYVRTLVSLVRLGTYLPIVMLRGNWAWMSIQQG